MNIVKIIDVIELKEMRKEVLEVFKEIDAENTLICKDVLAVIDRHIKEELYVCSISRRTI